MRKSISATMAIWAALFTTAARPQIRTIWDGVYTEGQAARGNDSYKQSCAGCHAADLRGDGTAPSLVEESFAFLYDGMTLGEFIAKMRSAMPPGRANSLPEQTYMDITAYVLEANTAPEGADELRYVPDALASIRIVKKP